MLNRELVIGHIHKYIKVQYQPLAQIYLNIHKDVEILISTQNLRTYNWGCEFKIAVFTLQKPISVKPKYHHTFDLEMRCAQQYNEFSKTYRSLMHLFPRSDPSWGKSSLKSMYKPSTTAIYSNVTSTYEEIGTGQSHTQE